MTEAVKLDFAKMDGLLPAIVQDAETSGNRLRVVSAAADCDQDTILFRVVVEGDGLVCHEGTVSCFTNAIAMPGEAKNGR